MEENEVMLAHQYKSNYQTIIARVKNRFLPKTIYLIGTLGEYNSENEIYYHSRFISLPEREFAHKTHKKKSLAKQQVDVKQFFIAQQNKKTRTYLLVNESRNHTLFTVLV